MTKMSVSINCFSSATLLRYNVGQSFFSKKIQYAVLQLTRGSLKTRKKGIVGRPLTKTLFLSDKKEVLLCYREATCAL